MLYIHSTKVSTKSTNPPPAKMSDIDKPLPNDAPNVMLTIRMIMNGKEVGSIIGKGGEIINNIRESSGAKIHISDGSVPERIVTVTGSTDAIFKSFSMICKKFEDDGPKEDRDGASSPRGGSDRDVPRPPVTLRLIVPASQCGSLIGKGGAKIKEIREVTGASIQVASEMLPNSTERAVTISGGSKAITQCIYNICCVMLESPPKGTTIPYTPKAGMGGGLLGATSRGGRGSVQENPLANLLGLGGQATMAAIASLAGSQIRGGSSDRRSHDRDDHRSSGGGGGGSTQTHEMSIPNDMIGCIIGRGGSKIAEIRQLSGAMIRISKSEDGGNSDRGGSDEGSERQITISGNPDSVALAKSLINMSLDLHKSKLEERDSDGGGRDGGSSSDRRDRRDRDRGSSYSSGGLGGLGSLGGSAANLGLAQLLAKPEALTALTTFASLSGLGGLGAGGLLAGLGGGPGQGSGGGGSSGHVTGVHRSRGGYGGSSRSSRDDDRGSRDSKRSKFAPY